jgi:hypothetical protein
MPILRDRLKGQQADVAAKRYAMLIIRRAISAAILFCNG